MFASRVIGLMIDDPVGYFRTVVRSREDPVWFAENVLGVKLFSAQRDILKMFYEGGYKRLILVAGMRSGKSTLASIMGVYEFFKLITLRKPAEHYGLMPEQPLFITVVAVSEEQAQDTVFANMKALVSGSEWLAENFDIKIKENKIICPSKNVTIRTISSWSTPSTV